jgi:ribosomal protein S18 acetylase RimI-like enzyme
LNELIRIHQGTLKLNLVKSNQPAMALYESCGFEVFEEFEGNMYECPILAVRMRLPKERNAKQSDTADADKPRR